MLTQAESSISAAAKLPEADDPIFAATFCEAFQRAVRLGGERVALRTRGGAESYSWRDYGERVHRIAAGLRVLGLRHGDTVAVQLSTRPEFHFIDLGVVHLGAISFGVYNTSTPAQIDERLQNAECRIYVTEQAFVEVAEKAVALYGRIEHLIVIDGDGRDHLNLEGLERLGEEQGDFDFDAAWRAVAPEDLITIVYTSGTTGPPKGVQWSHAGIMNLLRAWSQRLPLPNRAVSYLPMAHAGERLLTHYMPIGRAATVTCCPDIKQVLQHVQDAHPDFFVTVPRTWVKFRAAIEAEIDAVENPDKQRALREAVETGLKCARLEQAGESVPPALHEQHERAKALLRKEILEGFGLDQIRVAIIGSALVPAEVVTFFLALGVPLLEAYGLTEAHGFGSVWPALDDFKFGTTGKPLAGVELKLADDGEVLLRSNMNMVGYRKEPEATAAAIDAEGWLHTGDIGQVDEDGFLKIIDRKKDLIINQAGKNMSPTVIEGEIKRANDHIGQVVCVGDGRRYNVALLTLDTEGAAVLARRYEIGDPSIATVAKHPAVIAEMERAIAAANEHLSRVEQLKKFKLLDVEWRPDSDEMTPTMKVKRKQVEQKYAEVIDELYS